jgi:cyclic pyranopterin phosphate synthase
MNWVKDRPVSVRFIELMRTGGNQDFFNKKHLSAGSMRLLLLQNGWRQRARAVDDGPAVEFEHSNYAGRIGLIAPYSQDFCKSCNRLRVSSVGSLRLCLFGNGEFPLRQYLAADSQKNELQEIILKKIGAKPVSHYLSEGHYGITETLSSIGG